MTASFAIDSLTKRGENSWRLSYHSVSEDGARGKRLYKTLTGCSGKREARARAQAFLAQMAIEAPSSGGPTIAALLEEEMSKLLSTRAIEDSTYRGYTEGIRRLEWLGGMPVGDLSEEDVIRRISEMVDDGYSPSTVNDALQLCRRAVKRAVRRGLAKRDVTSDVKGPKRQQTRPRSLTKDERDRLIALLEHACGFLPVAVRLALSTGMRVGEICALQWKSVDIARGWLKVERAVGRGTNGKTYLKGPKSASSARKLPIEPGLAKVLEARLAEQRSRCEEARASFTEELYVVGDIDGSYPDPHWVGREFALLATASGLAGGECRFHWLRHTFATTMIAAGVDVRTVSAWLGHSDPSTTLKLYVDLDEVAMADSVDVLGKVLSPSKANRSLKRAFDMKPEGCQIVPFDEISRRSARESAKKA